MFHLQTLITPLGPLGSLFTPMLGPRCVPPTAGTGGTTVTRDLGVGAAHPSVPIETQVHPQPPAELIPIGEL